MQVRFGSVDAIFAKGPTGPREVKPKSLGSPICNILRMTQAYVF